MTTHYVIHRSSRHRARCVLSVPLYFRFLFSSSVVCVYVCVVCTNDVYPHVCAYGGPRDEARLCFSHS